MRGTQTEADRLLFLFPSFSSWFLLSHGGTEEGGCDARLTNRGRKPATKPGRGRSDKEVGTASRSSNSDCSGSPEEREEVKN